MAACGGAYGGAPSSHASTSRDLRPSASTPCSARSTSAVNGASVSVAEAAAAAYSRFAQRRNRWGGYGGWERSWGSGGGSPGSGDGGALSRASAPSARSRGSTTSWETPVSAAAPLRRRRSALDAHFEDAAARIVQRAWRERGRAIVLFPASLKRALLATRARGGSAAAAHGGMIGGASLGGGRGETAARRAAVRGRRSGGIDVDPLTRLMICTEVAHYLTGVPRGRGAR